MRRAAFVLLFMVATDVALPCGPWLPEDFLSRGDAALVTAPEASFHDELTLWLDVKPSFTAKWEPADLAARTREADVRELAEALAAAGMDADERARITAVYAALRSAPWGPDAGDRLPSGMPSEFEDYARGAIAWSAGDLPAATAAWERLLARRSEDRRFRSVWAAYMLGRRWHRDDPARAESYYVQARELAASGHRDALGLARDAEGWIAELRLARGEAPAALRTYLAQWRAGDPTAEDSLRRVARRILGRSVTSQGSPGPPVDRRTLDSVARDPDVRPVLTAYLNAVVPYARKSLGDMAHSGLEEWIRALEAAGVTKAREAERAAWLAYQGASFGTAARWVAMAPQDAPVANWIRAKLALRAGRVDESRRLLLAASRAAARGTPVPEPARLEGELASLEVAGKDWVVATSRFLAAGHWQDAAYLAERVLTVEELRDSLRSRPEAQALRELFARRLARGKQYDEAESLFPADERESLQEFRRLLEGGTAQGTWDAAKILRARGMELIGAELDPDWASFDGKFVGPPPSRWRAGECKPDSTCLGCFRCPEFMLVRPDPEELERANRSEPSPYARFHYRYLAADLAWEAAARMPDESDATAVVLNTAGLWLADRDPDAAERFYKALVRRCGTTRLGADAKGRRWFVR